MDEVIKMIPLISRSIVGVAIFANLLNPLKPVAPLDSEHLSDYKFDICYEGLEVTELDEEDIAEMARDGEREYLAQLVYAEAGNQDLTGKRLVADVVLNRVGDENFPDTITEVIFQPGQFGPLEDGRFWEAAWDVTEECYQAVAMEIENRLDPEVLYFNNTPEVYGGADWKYGGHWFGY